MDSIEKTNKIISTLQKLQFVAEFFIFSKVQENSDVIPEFLTLMEGIKFYLKSIGIAQSKGIYLENVQTHSITRSPI